MILKNLQKNHVAELFSLNESVKVLNVILFMYVIVDDAMHLLLFINKTLEPLLRYPVHSLTFTFFSTSLILPFQMILINQSKNKSCAFPCLSPSLVQAVNL